MKSNSLHDLIVGLIAPKGRRCLFVILVLLSAAISPTHAATPLAAMARMEAADRMDGSGVLALFRGYASRGLRLEASDLLERELRTGEIRRDEASTLFEQIVVEQARRDDPETLLALCEAALRNGARTPLILYSYGTGLRSTGRLSESSATLAQVDPNSPVHPYALYAIGQNAAAKGEVDAALDIFRRVRGLVKERPGDGSLGERAARAEAWLLVLSGRPAEAAPFFESRSADSQDPLVSVGSALAGIDNGWQGGNIPEDAVARRSVRERILLHLLQGGLSRVRGRYDSAVAHFTRAGDELEEYLLSATPPASEPPTRPSALESLQAQIEEHSGPRQRTEVVDGLIGLLVLDHTLVRDVAFAPAGPRLPGEAPMSAAEIGEVIRRIERSALGGVDIERLVEELRRTSDTMQNLAHPIQRYRHLARLEKGLVEIESIKGRIRRHRQAALEGIGPDGRTDIPRLLGDLGRLLAELDAVRAAVEEVQGFARLHFNILRRPDERDLATPGEGDREFGDALAFDRERFVSLSRSARSLEERARILAWERKKDDLRSWRQIIHRQVADALVGQARALRGIRPSRPRESWTALERAASYLSGDRLSPSDRIDCAINVASLLVEGSDRWGPFPEKPAGEREAALIAAILPALDGGATSSGRREESLFLSAIMRMKLRDGNAMRDATVFLRNFPGSPLAGDLAVRVGHESLLSGNGAEATALYRAAADGANPAASAAGRYMLGWIRFRNGDVQGATRDLSPILDDPGFGCEEPAAFERSVLSLAVRAWSEIPPELLSSYAPVRRGSCGGKLLLASLGEAEEKRGEASRAAATFDLLSRRFLSGQAALEYGKRSVEHLLRARKDDEAMSSALVLAEQFGPGSAWSDSQPPAVREKVRLDLAETLKAVSERKFDAGIRSGDRSAMEAAAAGIERLFAVKEEDSSDADAELKIKRAIALLRTGDRETGIDLLAELVGEQRADTIGERAAILYAESMIAGYERKEKTADDAEDSLLILMDDYPSEQALVLAARAAAAFLSAGDYEFAARTATSLETNKATPKRHFHQALLIRAEASMFLNDLPAARDTARKVLGVDSGEMEPGVRERAEDLLRLSYLKDIEARTVAEDWRGAAKLLEELGERHLDGPGAPVYLLRAVRLYRRGGDAAGAVRVGLLFIRKFPGREEGVEVGGTVGVLLEERKEYVHAADVYAGTAERFPKSDSSPRFLFLAACLARDHGDPNLARKRFSDYSAKYSNPRWMTAYASLSAGLLGWKGGYAGSAVRDMEDGLRLAEAGVEEGAPAELPELAGKARVAIGEYWAGQFRKSALLIPLEKSLAVKDRYFRKSLASFEKAEREAPLEVAVAATLRSGDLLVEFGKAIIASQRPRGIKGEERVLYEDALRTRARAFFERAVTRYAGALDRLEEDKGRSDLALSISQRVQETQGLLAGLPATSEAR